MAENSKLLAGKLPLCKTINQLLIEDTIHQKGRSCICPLCFQSTIRLIRNIQKRVPLCQLSPFNKLRSFEDNKFSTNTKEIRSGGILLLDNPVSHLYCSHQLIARNNPQMSCVVHMIHHLSPYLKIVSIYPLPELETKSAQS